MGREKKKEKRQRRCEKFYRAAFRKCQIKKGTADDAFHIAGEEEKYLIKTKERRGVNRNAFILPNVSETAIERRTRAHLRERERVCACVHA